MPKKCYDSTAEVVAAPSGDPADYLRIGCDLRHGAQSKERCRFPAPTLLGLEAYAQWPGEIGQLDYRGGFLPGVNSHAGCLEPPAMSVRLGDCTAWV